MKIYIKAMKIGTPLEKTEASIKSHPDEKNRGIGRKEFLRIAAGAASGLVIAKAAIDAGTGRSISTLKKATILSACTGCTGCVTICPTDAISVCEGGILISDKKCVSCGYCAAVCPSAGVRINRV